ncbi:bifunctional Delta(1)-pyrroline-2-carboxylate/Delta(1)-piperideine-2-carboxylate reductase [Pseudoduganella namucuonensis]|uniref:Ornithine cyclodeaminase n=1 Tax=Pseudoduganella namucuonensis TaxID=1035707 RepID=A0A1I7GY82_9BURK|nr:bifunctional Delta(1)-pyrroline-2-carboxylate/Delta(1)-piperideine-2-carboxylate reductase [Pseudoduganella namucuonensis]SFU53428.1 ornithine cyclodeaminase [Pseudoduganella namucuonensis]
MDAKLDARGTAALLPYPALVEALRLAVAQVADGVIACPERQVVPMRDGAALLSMVATAPDIAVHKLISVVPANAARGQPTILGQVSVVDAVTGGVALTLDGATVTGRRTAALSMLGVATLLGRAPRRVLLIGTGAQAGHHAQALGALYPGARVDVAGRDLAQAEAFCAQYRGACPALRAARPLAATPVADDTDVVVTCTTSKTPVYAEAARAGRLLVAVGAFKPDAAEIAPDTVRASRVYVDDPAGASHEAGDLIQAGVDWSSVRAFALALARPPRDGSPILFKTVGCAAWDLAAARVALATAAGN